MFPSPETAIPEQWLPASIKQQIPPADQTTEALGTKNLIPGLSWINRSDNICNSVIFWTHKGHPALNYRGWRQGKFSGEGLHQKAMVVLSGQTAVSSPGHRYVKNCLGFKDWEDRVDRRYTTEGYVQIDLTWSDWQLARPSWQVRWVGTSWSNYKVTISALLHQDIVVWTYRMKKGVHEYTIKRLLFCILL